MFQEDHHKHPRKRGRSTRAILSFVGLLSKTIFGTATMDDVNILAAHINAITTKTIKLSNILSQHAEHESTFMHSVDQGISNVVSTISDNHDEINILQRSLNTTTQNLESCSLLYCQT